MNSTALLKRIERLHSPARPRGRPLVRPEFWTALGGALPTLLAATILTLLLVSFQPFAAGSVLVEPGGGGGNKLNQIGYSLLAAGGLAALLFAADPRRLLGLPAFSWILVPLAYAVAILNTPEHAVALRVTAFSFATVIAMVSAVMLLRDERALQNTVALAAAVVLGLSYYGVFAMPGIARHTAEIFEPANEGLWRGIYQHKNIAGPVMAAFVFASVYLMRSGRRLVGGLLFAAALVFLLQSGSKTSAGTVVLVLSAVLLPSLFGLRGVAVLLVVLLLAVFGLFTNGTVIFGPINDIVQAVAPGNSYTGRITLWQFALEKIQERPFLGHGIDTLWAKPAVMDMERPFDSDWDFRGIVHGHSGYFDTALILGLPGAAVIFYVILIRPIRDYLACVRTRANIIAADFFLMVMLFTALNAFMETFFFRRGDPVWMLMVFALAGLRLVATEALKPRA